MVAEPLSPWGTARLVGVEVSVKLGTGIVSVTAVELVCAPEVPVTVIE